MTIVVAQHYKKIKVINMQHTPPKVKTNDDWKEDFRTDFGSLLDKPVCCERRNNDCGCDGNTYADNVIGWIEELLTQKDTQAAAEKEAALIAIMSAAHEKAIDDGSQYPKIRLHDLALIIGGDYHARLREIREAAVREWVTTGELPEWNTQVLCALQHFHTKKVIYAVLEAKEVDDACWFDGDGEIDEMNWRIIGWQKIQALTQDSK